MTSEMIKILVTKYCHPPWNLSHMRFLVLCLLGFAGFMRVSELLSIKIADICFLRNYMTINIETSKTDETREENVV